MPGQTSKGQPYSGVGLELYANTASYFRYATSGSEIDVRTDKFFFGNPLTTFISGSNGLLQISSSNFHLKANGDVTASNADIAGVAQANIIRQKSVTITSANSASYLQPLGSGLAGDPFLYNLRLDGALGGQRIQRVIFDVDIPFSRPLAGFYLPNITTGQSGFVYIEIAVSRSVHIDDTIGDMGAAAK
jgi:hypothetical protein